MHCSASLAPAPDHVRLVMLTPVTAPPGVREIAALTEADGDLGVFDARERFVLAFTDQLFHHVKADDAMFAQAQSWFNARQLSELVLTVGFYMMVSRFLENFEVDIEPPGTIE